MRLSGRRAPAILWALFRPGSTCPEDAPRCLCLGHIVEPDTGQVVDEVLVAYMPAPHTHTRQPVVEINTHGGGLVLRRVLRLCLQQGARQAAAGEFTLRAFATGASIWLRQRPSGTWSPPGQKRQLGRQRPSSEGP